MDISDDEGCDDEGCEEEEECEDFNFNEDAEEGLALPDGDQRKLTSRTN